jgi:hypothetical protein
MRHLQKDSLPITRIQGKKDRVHVRFLFLSLFFFYVLFTLFSLFCRNICTNRVSAYLNVL